MARTLNDPLLAAGKIIVLIGQGFMALAGAALIIGIPLVMFMQDTITREAAAEFGDPNFAFPTLAVIAVMVLALAIMVMGFYFLSRLGRIIDTVGDGDPFVPENAERLTMMAWLMLGVQVLAVPAAGLALYIAKTMEEQDATVDASLDFSGIILIIVLFILARVFRQGTKMREELEGTI